MIAQGVTIGIKRARAAGKHFGRPKIDPRKEARNQAALKAAKGILKVAAEVGVGSSTIQRIKAEVSAAA
jgi:DNA invertase Pin-like site-specific DNA recombinase